VYGACACPPFVHTCVWPVHSVVFGGFAASELAVRIDDAKPVVVVAATFGIEGTKVVEYMPNVNDAIEIGE